MILTNRLFERVPPSREAKNIYIFCEGAKREYMYFEYFRERDSRINIEVHKLHPHEDNSPIGLLKIAEQSIIESDANPNPKYDFLENDEVWIVLDIDPDKVESRMPQIDNVLKKIQNRKKWFLVRSNPCFEVWLYYHKSSQKPAINDIEKCNSWKPFVDSALKGGFDSRKHPVYIQKASIHAKANFKLIENKPDLGCTEVYKLADSIIPLMKDKLDRVLKSIEGEEKSA